MKRMLLLAMSLGLFSVNFAQIIITSAEMPIVGMLPRYTLPDSTQVVDPSSSAGANQTWDYSSLIPQFQRVDTFVTLPSNYASNFPGSTVALVQNGNGAGAAGFTFGKGYRPYKVSSSAFENMGICGKVSGIDMSLVNNPKDEVYHFPLNYADTDSSYSEATLSIPFFLYVRQEQTRQYVVDGWGTLMTPYKTYGCLRVRNEITGYDTVSVPSQSINFGNNRPMSIEYKWLSKNDKVAVFSASGVIFGGQEQIGNIYYRDTVQNVPYVGIENTMQSVKGSIYPNPATEKAVIALEKEIGSEVTWEVFDMTGKLVASEKVSPQQLVELGVGQLPAGIYTVKVSGKGKMFTGKLAVKH
ncbi:MAG: T9SS type A sorting domain-containing protein [Bacteroidia bacterium]